MRLADKAALQNSLVKQVLSCIMEEYPNVISYEVDGYSGYSGWLGKNQQYIIYTDLCKIYV